jgi:CheY-like chemotaxis protein
LEESVPDVLLLDFAMPGMTGAEVAARVRARVPDLPIIFASGYSETAAIESVVSKTAVILRKPFSVAYLETALWSAIGKGR